MIYLILSGVFVSVIGLWMLCINAFDRWDEQERRERQITTPVDRLIKYQDRDY
jgi:hypothetical protein